MSLPARVQRGVFSAVVRLVGGGLVLRDRGLRRIKPGAGTASMERVWIASGRQQLDAVWVQPAHGTRVQAAILICHGIGEVVEHWTRVQELLAESGVASLVFNYSGCGRSKGKLSSERCERDAVAAFWWLLDRVPDVPVTLLGFSLGSGVAAAVVERLPVAGLVLCEAYTSFREALCCAGIPQPACSVVPDVWRSADTLPHCQVPILVVHGERDDLFPVAMGERLAQAAGAHGTLIVVPAMRHPDLHMQARAQDWQPIVAWVCELSGRLKRGEAKV